MAPLEVHIKHAGKTLDVQLDPDLPPSVFKDSIYQLTGVPPERMKVMVKGGVLKDDTPWKKVGPKAGQTFMVIGAAGELPKPPTKPIVFLEDMDDAELAGALAKPVGLANLGNTCYMNATVQALRAVPELQVALNATTPLTPLPRALRDLYANMSRTTEGINPSAFLQVLRQVNPQFAEISRSAGGMPGSYAQQDAEECYGQIIHTLREVPGLAPPSPPPVTESTGEDAAMQVEGAPVAMETDTPAPASSTALTTTAGKKFVDQWLMGEMRRELRCDEAPDEPASITTESVLKIECNISVTTNYMLTGIMNSLDQTVTKYSPTLNRDASYTQHSRMTRLPAYLTVHMVRFAWRQDIGKKAKIMRKVKFPLELDALDLTTDALKARLLPVSRRLKEIEKERAERRKVRRRTKDAPAPSSSSAAPASAPTPNASAPTPDASAPDSDATAVQLVPGELEDEAVYRAREVTELGGLVDEGVRGDVGCSESGLYDLVAIVTHKGAAADAGHYIGFVKKSVFHAAHGAADPTAQSSGAPNIVLNEDDEDWYKFDDANVSVFPKEKLATLDGGGEDSSAYVLLYRTKPLV